uniref:SWIM-type domain-containing protein n=1 Tax=Plectus sambesii TaxID=2011161 RepID=A0A914W4F9_9BILA
ITMRGASSTFQERVKRDHIKAKYLLAEPDKVKEVENGRKWKVQSEATMGQRYEVEVRDDYTSNHLCLINCQFCQVCPHCYKCSCPYFEFRCGPMPCKHIHAVHSLFAQNAADIESDEDDVPVPSLPKPPPIDGIVHSLPELPPIDAYSSEGDETINADANDAINTDPDAPKEDTQRAVLLDQFCAKKAAIMQQLQVLDSLLEQCDDKEEIEAVLTMANHLQQMLQTSIERIRLNSPPVLPIGPRIRKRKMTPQKTSTPKVLALPKRPKKPSKCLFSAAPRVNSEHGRKI